MTKQKTVIEAFNETAYEYAKKFGYDQHHALPSLKKFLGLLPPKANVLDAGCGGGQDSKFLSENNCSVTGIDGSEEMIKLSKKYAPKAAFAILNLKDLSKEKKYDGIWCSAVFHHISIAEQDDILNIFNNSLKKEGILYITSAISDEEKDYEAYDADVIKILKKRLTPDSFKNLIINHGFKIIEFNRLTTKRHMEIFARKI
ncbi:MAG: methyltransferase domain-containing protein [bacterium]